jgi:hypothetical protein
MTLKAPEEKKASPGTLRGLDWLNFFLADVQTGVGPFLAIYLAAIATGALALFYFFMPETRDRRV